MRSNLFAGALGGLIVAVVVAVLLGTGTIDTGDTTTVVQRQAPLSRSAGSSAAAAEEGGGMTVGDIYKQAGPGVAYIQSTIVETTPSPFGLPDEQPGEATGSGFVLNDQGYIATNAHVVNGAKDVQVSFGKSDPVPAKVVGKDLSTDLAVIKIDPSKVPGGLTTIPLGDSSTLRVGDPVVAIGNPFGFDDTVTTGIVSALGREIQAPNNFSIDHTIQTDAAINPGNSGGPLLDQHGRVVGINSQIATGGASKGSVGIGFAIPVNLAKQVFPALIKNGRVPHAYIGITTTGLTSTIVQDLNLPASEGALVQAVEPGSPADKAGVKAGQTQTAAGLVAGGDLIVGVDGKPITDPTDISNAIATKKPGDSVSIELYRGRTKKTVTITLADRPAKAPNTP